MSIRRQRALVPAIGAAVLLAMQAASAQSFDFKGSLGEAGGHRRYVPPLANPLFNETPYITTEIRPIYFYNDIPNKFITGGGHMNVVAAELRVALTERLGFIASKDGYADIDFKRTLPDESGFANISLGFKYALISDPASNSILTVGIEYEPPTGNLRPGGVSLQGDGDGFVDLFVTGAKAFGKLGLQGSIGTNLAIDGDHDSSILHYSAHVDYEVLPNFFPLFELNGFTVIDRGKRTPLDFEGVDLVNFGSTSAGTVITATLGGRYRVNSHLQFGAGYETPITDREDILGWRVYFDVVLSY